MTLIRGLTVDWTAVIGAGIRNEIERITAEEADAAAARGRQRVADAAPTIAAKLLDHFDLRRDESRIVIEVRKLREPGA